MWMALPRHGCCSEHLTAGNAPCTVEPQPRYHEGGANRTDKSDSSLRSRS
jgi:hypothetical protein